MLTEREAFEAMKYSLTECWKRGGGRADSDLVDVLSWTGSEDCADSTTNDPAQWHDWVVAARAVQSGDRARPW